MSMSNPVLPLFHAVGPGTRREFLRRVRDFGALLALGSLPSCRGDRPSRLGIDPFGLGVASGDPTPDGIVLWTRLVADPLRGDALLEGVQTVAWELAADESFRQIVRSGSETVLPELAHSLHLELDGLEPGRDYWYRFMTNDATSPVGRARTAPAAGGMSDRFRFAFVSCQHWEQGLYTAYQHLAQEDVDLVVHLGDYIYEYGPDLRVREHNGPEIMSLADYRRRLSLYKSDPLLKTAHERAPFVVTWDDHEVDNNYAGAISQDDDPRDAFLLRRAAAYQAYWEHQPLRRAQMPTGPDALLYRRLRFGGLIEMSVLDTRQYRTDQPCGDGRKPRCAEAYLEEATMMGAEQERWLMENMARSDARWNVLANQVMMSEVKAIVNGAESYSLDQWAGYVAPRQRLTGFLAETRPSNPVVLTGDIHSNWVADIKVDYEDAVAPVVATEFVGTSISSGGDGQDSYESIPQTLSMNPHVKLFNGQRGYVSCTVTPDEWRADYQVVDYVSRPGAPVRTRASFVVENGRAGAQEV
ncbi:MAG: alkaline phosphatase D family protein [Gemmatimonadota bacterium]